jgi:hypothetical protein
MTSVEAREAAYRKEQRSFSNRRHRTPVDMTTLPSAAEHVRFYHNPWEKTRDTRPQAFQPIGLVTPAV